LKRLVYLIPIAFILSLFFPRCAIIVAPTGGPKDTIPPVLVRSVPTMNATNVKRDRISLTFDEYIKLDKISEKLVLSPPQERLPEFKIRGKSIEMRFFEPLIDSTTYTLYFDDAIVDNNEGNKLENFEFAFSTGSIIDSLRFNGKLIDAFTLEPVQGAFVMLYTSFKDSIPIKERPRYVTKSNKEGLFTLSNLKYNNYKIFALADGNSNYKFDQVSEKIAFHPSPIDKSMLLGPSLAKLQTDSLLTLYLFQEENRTLYLTDFSRPQRRHIKFGFSRPPVGEVNLKAINAGIDTLSNWYLKGINPMRDSINFWITNDAISRFDSLVVVANYQKTDSVMNLVEVQDTIRLFHIERSQTARRGRREDAEEEKKPVLKIKTSHAKGTSITPVENLKLTFGMPLAKKDTSLIELFSITDSAKVMPLGLRIDSLDPRIYHLNQIWKNNTSYQLTVLPGAFTNLDGITNDTLILGFKGADSEQFGIIRVTLSGVTPNILVQLTTDKGVVVDEKTAQKDGVVTFNYVKPAKYHMRFVHDANQNGVWDTGWYLEGKQPEKVFNYQDGDNREIQVRANWEYDLSFNLKDPNDVSSDELRDVPNTEGFEREPIRIEGGKESTR
jgi:hypothetical protein